MSISNLLTLNNKSYQDIECDSIKANTFDVSMMNVDNLTANNLNVTNDLSANNVNVLTDLSANNANIVNTLDASFISVNGLSANNAIINNDISANNLSVANVINTNTVNAALGDFSIADASSLNVINATFIGSVGAGPNITLNYFEEVTRDISWTTAGNPASVTVPNGQRIIRIGQLIIVEMGDFIVPAGPAPGSSFFTTTNLDTRFLPSEPVLVSHRVSNTSALTSTEGYGILEAIGQIQIFQNVSQLALTPGQSYSPGGTITFSYILPV